MKTVTPVHTLLPVQAWRMKNDVVFMVLTKVGKYEHRPQPAGPSSLVSIKTPSDVYRESAVSPVHTASERTHVPPTNVY